MSAEERIAYFQEVADRAVRIADDANFPHNPSFDYETAKQVAHLTAQLIRFDLERKAGGNAPQEQHAQDSVAIE